MDTCIFCQIVKGEIPSKKVYEDDYVLAFLDISYITPGHTLVIPKKHAANYEELETESLAQVFLAVKKIGLAIKRGLGVPAYNTGVNNGAAAGQIIPHFHVHIIPRLENDGLLSWPSSSYQEGEAEDVLKKIKAAFL